jgi:hypothetical protein
MTVTMKAPGMILRDGSIYKKVLQDDGQSKVFQRGQERQVQIKD